MKFNYQTQFIISLVLLSINQSGWAITPSNGINLQASKSPSHSETITQRGGMITGIDPNSHIISIDGISYLFQSTSIPIHSYRDKIKLAMLEQGMLIRFNTVNDGYNGKEAISEIWITPKNYIAPKK